MVSLDEIERYRERWQGYRRLRRFCFGLVVAIVPVGALASALGSAWGVLQLGPICGALVFCVLWVSLFRLAAWRCPRCEQHYFIRKLTQNVFGMRCQYCGLPKWSVNATRS